MESTSTPLSAALQLRDAPDGRGARVFATIAPDWAQGRATFGGLVGALGVRALERLSQGRSVRAVTVTFCAPTEPGEVEIQLELLRSGKSLLHAQARLVQEGQVRAVIIGAFGEARATGLSVDAPRAPEAPPIESLERMPFVQGMMPTFLQHFDFRFSAKGFAASDPAHGKIAGMVRALDADRVDAAVVVALADAFPPPFMPLLAAPARSSSVSWLVNFVGEPSETSPDAFWQLTAQTLDAIGGYSNVEAQLWDADGKLRAISRQLVAEFSPAKP